MKTIINDGKYDIIWTNEPVMGVVTRLAAKRARKDRDESPLYGKSISFLHRSTKNKLDDLLSDRKMMASKADIICTVNREDYARAKGFEIEKT